VDKLLLLDNECSSLQKMIQEFETGEERLGRLESGLREQLQQTTGKSDDLENLIQAFEDGCRGKRAYEEARGGLRQNEEKKGIILQGKSPGELQETVRKIQDELELIERSAAQLAGAQTGQNRESLGALLSRQQGALRDSELLASGLRSKINTRLSGLRGRAEVEEDLGRYERELAMLERFGEELKVATEGIELAMTEAHRDFAPSVGRFLGEGLARVTQDRYGRVLIDPSTLRLTTEVPETRRLEDVERLSRGTRAAAYLLLRVGLAQHMSSLAEPVPLILDDPLVDLDDVREENFLDLLLDLTSEVQVLLFSKNDRVREWFERRCARTSRHRATLLPTP
jgi:DNA repair exonuclease SbcCD ATPase subunit